MHKENGEGENIIDLLQSPTHFLTSQLDILNLLPPHTVWNIMPGGWANKDGYL